MRTCQPVWMLLAFLQLLMGGAEISAQAPGAKVAVAPSGSHPDHECFLPPPPTKVPNGATASQEDMIGAMRTLKEYSEDVGNFLKCLEFEATQNRMTRQDEITQHNAAVDTLRIVAERFNVQVRLFKDAHPG